VHFASCLFTYNCSSQLHEPNKTSYIFKDVGRKFSKGDQRKKKPKNNTVKSLSTLSVLCMKIQGGMPSLTDAHEYLMKLTVPYQRNVLMRIFGLKFKRVPYRYFHPLFSICCFLKRPRWQECSSALLDPAISFLFTWLDNWFDVADGFFQ